jgi:toxin YoeB
MSLYQINLEKLAEKQLNILKNNKKMLKKAMLILEEISIDPYSTTHKFEKLKYNLCGSCSKRLDKKNRILYRVIEQEIIVIIISVSGHYE